MEFTIANFILDYNSILKQRTCIVEAEQEISALQNVSGSGRTTEF